MRGYFAFNIRSMRDTAFEHKAAAKDLIEAMEEASDTEADKRFLAEVLNFHNFYSNELLPKQLKIYESMKEMDKDGIELQENGTKRITAFQNTLEKYRHSIELQIQDNFNTFSEQQVKSQWIFLIFVIVTLLLLLTMIRSRLKTIGEPLHELAIASEEISAGREVTIPKYDGREDEISILSRSFEKMIKSIQENEQISCCTK